tara:strand:- start:81 stop:488 length:408 start_codon:yes stop_codon:yes gene_type:complete
MKVIPKENEIKNKINEENDDEDEIVWCLKINDPCSKKTIQFNMTRIILFISIVLIFTGIIICICLQGYMYQNTNFTKTEKALVIGLSTIYIESIISCPIIFSICLNEPLWYLIIVNIVYLIIQTLFMLATLLNIE